LNPFFNEYSQFEPYLLDMSEESQNPYLGVSLLPKLMLISDTGLIDFYQFPHEFNLIGNLRCLFHEDFPIDNTIDSTRYIPHVEAVFKEKESLFEFLQNV